MEPDRQGERIDGFAGVEAPQRHGKASQGGCAGIAPPRDPAGRSPPADVLHGRGLCGVPRATRRILPPLRPLLDLVPDREAFIGEGQDKSFNERLRGHASTGRPLGSDAFVESLERRPARSLKRRKPGPKPQERDRYTGDLFGEGERD